MKCIFALDRPGNRQQWGAREPERAFGRNLAHTQPTMETMARNNTTAHFCEQCSLYGSLQNGYWKRGRRRYSTPNTGVSPVGNRREYSTRERTRACYSASALSCNFGLVARRQIFLCSQLGALDPVVVRCRLFHLLCADSYKLVEGECTFEL